MRTEPRHIEVSRNRLLRWLPAEDRARLFGRMRRVSLVSGQVLTPADQPVRSIHFPETAVISLVASMRDGTPVEVATVGAEGFAGLPILLGTGSMPIAVLAQVAGESWRLDADAYEEELGRSPALRDASSRYLQGLFVQTAQSVACNRLHPISERTARWLLMSADRAGADTFRLTQEFLATMLGVHRPSVTVAAGELQRRGAISYHRGLVRIVDRDALERASCECYDVIRREFDTLLGQGDANGRRPALELRSGSLSAFQRT